MSKPKRFSAPPQTKTLQPPILNSDQLNSEIDEILQNGWIKSKLYSAKSDATLWQAEVTMELTETVKAAIQTLINKARVEENELIKLVTYRQEMVRYADKRIAELSTQEEKDN